MVYDGPITVLRNHEAGTAFAKGMYTIKVFVTAGGEAVETEAAP